MGFKTLRSKEIWQSWEGIKKFIIISLICFYCVGSIISFLYAAYMGDLAEREYWVTVEYFGHLMQVRCDSFLASPIIAFLYVMMIIVGIGDIVWFALLAIELLLEAKLRLIDNTYDTIARLNEIASITNTVIHNVEVNPFQQNNN